MGDKANYVTLQVWLRYDDGPPPDERTSFDQGNPGYVQLEGQLRQALRAELVQGREGFGMEFEVPAMGRMVLNVQTIQHTAAVVRVGVKRGGKHGETAGDAPDFAGAWLLLSGFADADKAAVDSLRVLEEVGAQGAESEGDRGMFPPEALDAMADAPRPAVIQLCHPVLEETGTRELFLIAYAAFAEAFFGQFGQSGEENMKLPPPPL